MNIINDGSYNIKEIEVNPGWIRDLGLDYRKYRKKWDMANRGHLFDFPLFLEVETSYACNYRCPKCPRQAINHTQNSGFLNDALIDKILAEAKKYHMPSITFSHGGEPLMRRDLPLLIRKTKEAGILDRMFHTNGLLLGKDLSRELIESGLTKINFSLDAASAEIYNKVRPGGDYLKVVANINDFLEIKKRIGKSYPRVRVSFVVSEENRHEQKKFYELWKDKVNIISFQRCYDFTKLNSSDDNDLSICSSLNYSCTQLWQLLTISYEGDILICEHDYNHNFVLGNLNIHSIYECWHSKVINDFRKLHKDNKWHQIPLCRKCVNSLKEEK